MIYGELDSSKWVKLYEDISHKIKSISNPLICIGDWNCLWFKKDKRGGDRISPKNLVCAKNIIDEGNLIDIGHYRPQFTWINRRGEGLRSLSRKSWIEVLLTLSGNSFFLRLRLLHYRRFWSLSHYLRYFSH